MKNTEQAYSGATKTLHWLVFLLMAGLSVVGFIFGEMPRGDEKTNLIVMHASTGLLLFVLMVLRVYIRASSPKVAPLDPGADKQNMVAHITHLSLYVGIFVMMGAGMLTVLTGGRNLPFFGIFSIPTPFERNVDVHHLFEEIHEVCWWVLAALVALHLVGALYHAFVLKDETLSRMGRG